jgi:hypothetical protein
VFSHEKPAQTPTRSVRRGTGAPAKDERLPATMASFSTVPSQAGLVALQRTIGNAAVVRMLADQQPVQRSAVHEVLRAPGTPLDEPTRTDMEARLGADFSDVRLHTDLSAQHSAAEIGARAYTSGNHVVIGSGGADAHTLAHELTHVIQQRQGSVDGTDNGDGLRISNPSDRFEREAEANATRAMSAAQPPERAPAVSGDQTSEQPTVQRMIGIEGESEGELQELQPEQVANLPQVQGFSPDRIERLKALAESENVALHLEQALDQSRNTVVGAISGPHPQEGDFLANVWEWREGFSAYDPDMIETSLRAQLGKRGVPPDAGLLHKASISEFGTHVPHTDVLVPHPGPWIYGAAPTDLATCLERVLGTDSHAYVLTDSEPTAAYAETLRQRIIAINEANANADGYQPLAVTIEVVPIGNYMSTQLGANPEGQGGAELKASHPGEYRLIKVSRP